jgi:hypothetical protein
MTAAEEDRMRRKAAYEAAQVRKIYEELVLKQKSEPVVQIGSLTDIRPIGAAPVKIAAAPAIGGNGHAPGNGNGNGHDGSSPVEKHEEAAVAHRKTT